MFLKFNYGQIIDEPKYGAVAVAYNADLLYAVGILKTNYSLTNKINYENESTD